MKDLSSWGHYPQAMNQTYCDLSSRHQSLPAATNILPRGLGRSYGDSCLNEDGLLVGSGNLKYYMQFDPTRGKIRCEAGISFDEILQLIVPRGWFLPVTPGTRFVTVAGAIANDVHGKNHHQNGNFGHHVTCFELLRSSGERLLCSRTSNADLFHATLGGLGLTGFITWAEFNLTKIESSKIDQEQIKFDNLADFFRLSAESENAYDFTVSWVDCLNTNDVRGIFIRGNFHQRATPLIPHRQNAKKTIPFFFPEMTLNKFSIKAFNELYYRKNLFQHSRSTIEYDTFFYPLDSILHWNKIYGRRGFLQYQFVVPYKNDGGAALSEIFQLLQKSQMGSFLAVLKTFGPILSEGLLSFPKEGVTLALDFPNYGPSLLKVLSECDRIVRSAQGAVYPAKDARMSAADFEAFFPQVHQFEKHIDPQFSSSFWRRVR